MQQAHSKLLAAQMLPIRKLKIAYCLPHHNVTGGLKMMLQQVGEAWALHVPCNCCLQRWRQRGVCMSSLPAA